MAWKPAPLPNGPISKQDSDTSMACPLCDAPAGEPCRSAECGTWDHE